MHLLDIELTLSLKGNNALKVVVVREIENKISSSIHLSLIQFFHSKI